jgi:hypothetical protein
MVVCVRYIWSHSHIFMYISPYILIFFCSCNCYCRRTEPFPGESYPWQIFRYPGEYFVTPTNATYPRRILPRAYEPIRQQYGALSPANACVCLQ